MFKGSINRLFLAIILIAMALVSCQEQQEGEIVAEAYGQRLYLSEVQKALSPGLSFEDSVFVVKEYINYWVAQQVVLNESKQVLSPEELDKESELQSYKNDLLVYETLNKLAAQKVDSNFSEDELMQYYLDNLQEFVLSENIIKFCFLKLPQSLPKLNDHWLAFKSAEADYDQLAQLAKDNRGNYFIDTSAWVYFDDILKEIPINTYNQEHFLNNNKNFQIKEGQYVYLVKILDFRIKSGNSPFAMERDRIKKILSVKKQQTYVKAVETELIQKAYSNNKVIIH